MIIYYQYLQKYYTLIPSDAIVEADSDREKKLLNSRLVQLEANIKRKEESEQEMKSKLLETVAAVEKVNYSCLLYLPWLHLFYSNNLFS